MALSHRPPFVLTPFEKVAVDEEGKTRRFRVPPELLEDGGGSRRRSGIRRSPSPPDLGAPDPASAAPPANGTPPSNTRPSIPRVSEAAASSCSRAEPRASTPAPARSTAPPPLPKPQLPPSPRAAAPCVPLAEIGLLLRSLQEHLGPAAPWLLKQELLRRNWLPSTVPLGQLGSLVDELARHLDSPEARERFRANLVLCVRADLAAQIGVVPEKKGG